MEYNKVPARKWQFNCAESGMHPNWSFDRARDFSAMAQEVGIEPWKVFPGTRQVQMETYDEVSPYQVSLLAQNIEKSKLGKQVAKVWMSGSYRINIDYVEKPDPNEEISRR
jgi:hypothetical protein